MKKLIITIGIVLACSAGIVNNTFAGYSWDKFKEDLSDIDPTNPNGSMGRDLHAKIRLCNKTNGTVHYAMGTSKASLKRGHCVSWTIRGQGSIGFDREFRRGYQGKTYRLNDGTYNFINANWPVPNFNGNMPGIDIRRQ